MLDVFSQVIPCEDFACDSTTVAEIIQLQKDTNNINWAGSDSTTWSRLKEWRINNIVRDMDIENGRIIGLSFGTGSMDVIHSYGLDTLSPLIGKLSHLKRLILSANKIGSLPKEIGQLSKLETLIYDSQKLASIYLPKEVNQLTSLKFFAVNDKVSSNLFEVFKLNNLEHLSLKNQGLTEFPSALLALDSLKRLDLSYNNITDLPSSWNRLKKLHHLILIKNQVKRIPAAISELVSLEYLDLDFNNLSAIPETLFTMENLSFLDFSRNQLSEISPRITQLPNLKTLELSSNKIKHLPDNIGEAPKLNHLHIMHNKLTDLPASIQNLFFYRVPCTLTDKDHHQNYPNLSPPFCPGFGAYQNQICDLPASFDSWLDQKHVDLGYQSCPSNLAREEQPLKFNPSGEYYNVKGQRPVITPNIKNHKHYRDKSQRLNSKNKQ